MDWCTTVESSQESIPSNNEVLKRLVEYLLCMLRKKPDHLPELSSRWLYLHEGTGQSLNVVSPDKIECVTSKLKTCDGDMTVGGLQWTSPGEITIRRDVDLLTQIVLCPRDPDLYIRLCANGKPFALLFSPDGLPVSVPWLQNICLPLWALPYTSLTIENVSSLEGTVGIFDPNHRSTADFQRNFEIRLEGEYAIKIKDGTLVTVGEPELKE